MRYFSLPVLLICTVLITACSTAPKVHDSKTLIPVTEKFDTLRLAYRNSEMRTVGVSGIGRTFSEDNNFSGFGGWVSVEARTAFAKHKVSMSEVKVYKVNTPIAFDNAPSTSAKQPPPILVLTPRKGRVSGNDRKTTAEYELNLQLLDGRTGELIWQATADTYTFAAKDNDSQEISGSTFGQDYAAKLLDAIAFKMHADGLIE